MKEKTNSEKSEKEVKRVIVRDVENNFSVQHSSENFSEKTIKEQVIEEMKKQKIGYISQVDDRVIELTENLTRKECEEEFKEIQKKAFNEKILDEEFEIEQRARADEKNKIFEKITAQLLMDVYNLKEIKEGLTEINQFLGKTTFENLEKKERLLASMEKLDGIIDAYLKITLFLLNLKKEKEIK